MNKNMRLKKCNSGKLYSLIGFKDFKVFLEALSGAGSKSKGQRIRVMSRYALAIRRQVQDHALVRGHETSFQSYPSSKITFILNTVL